MSDSENENSQGDTSDVSSTISSADEAFEEAIVIHQRPRFEYAATCPFVATSDGFLFCTICKTGVVPSPGSTECQIKHIKKLHNGKGFVPNELVDGLKTVDQIRQFYDAPLGKSLVPLDLFPIISGYQCSICSTISVSIRKMRGHLKTHTNIQASVACHSVQVFVQRPFKWLDNRKQLSFQRSFLVECPTPPERNSQQLQKWILQSHAPSQAVASEGGHATESVSCLFKWGKCVCQMLPKLTGSNLAMLLQGTALPDEGWFGVMFNHTQAYFQKIVKDTVNNCEESGNYLVLQLLRQENVEAAPPARGFYCLQEDSLKSYSVTAVRLLAFLKRCKEDGAILEPQFKEHMQCDALDHYITHPSMKTLHAVFVFLFCPTLSETTHDMSSHVCAFMRLASLGQMLVVDDASRVMQLTSRLKYLIKSCILIEVRSVGVYSVFKDPVENRMSSFQKFVFHGQNNVMSRVVSVAKVAFSVALATFTSVSTSSDGSHVCINNKTVMLTAIQGMVHSLISECKDLLTTMSIDYRALTGTHIADEIVLLNSAAAENHQAYSQLGYNIFHGSHFALKDSCLIKIGRWFNADGDPNVHAMREFFVSSASLQQKLFGLLHLTAGSPSRGAEMTRWRWQTTPDGPACIRFDAVKHLIYMFFQSTKTSRASQSDKHLVKYMGEELTRLVVAFAFVRRLEILFSICLGEATIFQNRLQSHIFVIDGLPLSPQDYSQILRKTCTRFQIPSMGLREFRQVMIAFGKYHLQQFSEISAIKDHIERFMAFQSGHSVSTHRITYGQLKGAVCEADMQSFMVASFAYLWLLRLPVPKIGAKLVPAFGIGIMAKCGEMQVTIEMQEKMTGDDALVQFAKTKQKPSLPLIEDCFYKEAISRLRTIFGVGKFKSRLQQHAIAAAIKGEELLYVAPCGSGKSNLIWLGFEQNRCTVLIVPYRILRTQMALTAESMGLKTLNFCEQTKASLDVATPPDILIVSYEQIPYLSPVLFALGTKLQRIILDEIQICFSEEFRLIVGQFKRWRAWLAFGAPIVYLSGSFPTAWEPIFQEAFGSPLAHVPIIREGVVRENIALEFVMNDSWFDLFHILGFMSAELEKINPKGKTMIFVMHRHQCAKVQQFLLGPLSPHKLRNIFMYWSGQEDEDQTFLSAQFQSFRRSENGILVCTHAGAIGADVTGVSLVFHLEGAHSLVSYFQATGRCGRDGSLARAIFLSNDKILKKGSADSDVLAMATTNQCKRRYLSNFLTDRANVLRATPWMLVFSAHHAKVPQVTFSTLGNIQHQSLIGFEGSIKLICLRPRWKDAGISSM